MGTKERLDILNEKYMTQEEVNDIWKNAKVRITRNEEPIKLYSKKDIGEIERLNNIINKLQNYLSSKKEMIEVELILDKLQELKGSDKE